MRPSQHRDSMPPMHKPTPKTKQGRERPQGERVVLTLQRSAATQIRLSTYEYLGNRVLDLRRFYQDGNGVWRATTGVRLRVTELDRVGEAIRLVTRSRGRRP